MLIGLHGPARSGKDTVAGYILEWAREQGLAARRDGFADRLKLSAARALGFDGNTRECIEWCNVIKEPGWDLAIWRDGHEPEILETGREYLQRYGTEAHREVFDTDFWINAVLDEYNPNEILVISDVRFENEAQAVRDRGGQNWRVERPSQSQITESGHASEQRLSDSLMDYVVYNEGTMHRLRDTVMSALDIKLPTNLRPEMAR